MVCNRNISSKVGVSTYGYFFIVTMYTMGQQDDIINENDKGGVHLVNITQVQNIYKHLMKIHSLNTCTLNLTIVFFISKFYFD